MKNNRTLIIGLTLTLLIVIGILFFPGAGQHHAGMMSPMHSMGRSSPGIDEDDPEAAQFRQTCTQCHGLPSPGRYTANEWPLIIDRMKQHMIESGIPLPDNRTTALILDYLEKNANQPSS